MSEEKGDTASSTCQGYRSFDCILKIFQTLILLGILISLAVLTSQLRDLSTVLGDIINQGSLPVVIDRLPAVSINGVVSVGNQPNGALSITNLGSDAFEIRSIT